MAKLGLAYPTDYLKSLITPSKTEAERRQEIYDKYGIANMETAAFQTPDKTFEDIYKQAYEQAGLGSLKTQIDAAQAELDKATADYNSGVEDINKNPWKSEAGRVGAVRRIYEAYNATATRLQAKVTTLQNQYDRGKTEAENVATRTLSELEKGTQLAKEKLDYLTKRAEADLESAQTLEEETAAKELYRYYPQYVANLAIKETPELKQLDTGEWVWIYKPSSKNPQGLVVKTGAQGKTTSEETYLSDTNYRELLLKGITKEVADAVMMSLKEGLTLEQIRQGLVQIYGENQGHLYLDTIIQYLQNETTNKNVFQLKTGG